MGTFNHEKRFYIQPKINNFNRNDLLMYLGGHNVIYINIQSFINLILIIMQNVSIKEEGNILTVTVDLSKSFGPSKSGKTISIASTLGNKKLDKHQDVFVGVNVYKSR